MSYLYSHTSSGWIIRLNGEHFSKTTKISFNRGIDVTTVKGRSGNCPLNITNLRAYLVALELTTEEDDKSYPNWDLGQKMKSATIPEKLVGFNFLLLARHLESLDFVEFWDCFWSTGISPLLYLKSLSVLNKSVQWNNQIGPNCIWWIRFSVNHFDTPVNGRWAGSISSWQDYLLIPKS